MLLYVLIPEVRTYFKFTVLLIHYKVLERRRELRKDSTEVLRTGEGTNDCAQGSGGGIRRKAHGSLKDPWALAYVHYRLKAL